MAEQEIKYFNVKNISVRLVHIGGVMVGPEQIVPVVDDELGINRASVEASEYLEEINDDAIDNTQEAEPKPKATKSAAKTASGASWSAPK